MARKSFAWFEKRHRTNALDLAQEQITKALDTTNLLHQIVRNVFEGQKEEAAHHIEKLFAVEKEVDSLRTGVFKELSKGTALFSDYREDIMHLVNRLDTLADHVKDATRCVKMLTDSEIPKELWQKQVGTTSTLVKCAHALRSSIEQIMLNPAAAIEGAKEVEEIESEIDQDYLETKILLIKHADQMNCGTTVIFDHLIEFIERAADMCADTADYIVILASGQ